MQPNSTYKPGMKVGDVLKKRLRETKQTVPQLAEAVEVPTEYIEALIDGSRRPPLPGRTDVYERMTKFLRLGRNDLVECAKAQRAGPTTGARPSAEIRKLLMAMCEVEMGKTLEKRAKKNDEELTELIGRLLDVAQGSVRRILDDQIAMRIAASQNGISYVEMRLRVLDFLDATPGTLTVEDLAYFVRPQIELWDVNLDTGVLRVVLKTREPQDRNRRRPMLRRGGRRMAG